MAEEKYSLVGVRTHAYDVRKVLTVLTNSDRQEMILSLGLAMVSGVDLMKFFAFISALAALFTCAFALGVIAPVQSELSHG